MKKTANILTIARIILMPIPGRLLYGKPSELMIAFGLIVALGLTDWIDGIIARKEGPSVLGGLLDPIADKIFIAVIYLPLTEQGIVPVWMTACIFARDFIVTALRTTLYLKDAPMRTSTLAKYKTAMQMMGIGYVVLYTAFTNEPDSFWVYLFIVGPIAIPLTLSIYRLVTKKKQGPRSLTMMALMTLAMLIRLFLGPTIAIWFTLATITAMTVVSGFSYIVDAWSALKGSSDSGKEVTRFLLEVLLLPTLFIILLIYSKNAVMSTAIILLITVELAVGGLSNLLASHKIKLNSKITTLKSSVQTVLAIVGLYFAIQDSAGGNGMLICALFGSAITCTYAAGVFFRYRFIFLKAL